mmetsp:Transcript_111/g.256  ORF Transcript_111/g.256 Transcript_111/m.256 type:complete len:526 (+) Transcript_111:3-1580(+)
MVFTPGSGGQGGRNWCRCDQCGYAAGWCGQHATPPRDDDTRLIGGSWYIENVKAELDAPDEWYFDGDAGLLYLRPNRSSPGKRRQGPLPPPKYPDLVASHLDTLVRIVGSQAEPVSKITIRGIGFRDTASTYMREFEWGAPSGGDWALRRGGAVFVEGAEEVQISDCTFTRLDGNAIFLSRYTRNVSIVNNEFSFIGEGAMATWGETQKYDATGGDFPMYTLIKQNYIREIGIYEKQSSGWGQAKACASTITENIMFNMPRAAINFNDMMGGGNLVSKNLLWNTCRESGDHGPINTWDRMPFLTTLKDGKPSFDPEVTRVTDNFIFANYGGSQGIDNDDGSSWYDISHNVFYSADGFKMDYGGHDSAFRDNLVVVLPYDGQNCYNVGPFLPDHVDLFKNNTCVCGASTDRIPSGCGSPACRDHSSSWLPLGTMRSREAVMRLSNVREVNMEIVATVSECDISVGGAMLAKNNRYFTPLNNASLDCGGTQLSLADANSNFGIEEGSTQSGLPEPSEILQWAEDMMV